MKRDKNITFRLSEDEKSMIDEGAKANGMTKIDFLVTAIKNYSNNDGSARQYAEDILLKSKEKDKKILSLDKKLSFFLGQKRINAAFQKYKGQKINFNDYKGNPRTVIVNAIQDIYRVILFQNKIS